MLSQDGRRVQMTPRRQAGLTALDVRSEGGGKLEEGIQPRQQPPQPELFGHLAARLAEGIVHALGDGFNLNDARGEPGQSSLAGVDALADAPHGVGRVDELGVVLIH